MRNRLRQRAIVSLLKSHDGPPTILATQIFFLHDAPPAITGITDNMTMEQTVMAVGKVLHSRQRLREDVDSWARNLFEEAGLPFNGSGVEAVSDAPVPGLSVVPSQTATPKTETQAVPKRKSRRVYLELAIKLLERGSCTHKELVDAIMEQHPSLNRQTVETFGYDVQNVRYSPIKDRKVVKLDGRLIFKDSIKPALTVIENPNYGGNEKIDDERSIDGTALSGEDV